MCRGDNPHSPEASQGDWEDDLVSRNVCCSDIKSRVQIPCTHMKSQARQCVHLIPLHCEGRKQKKSRGLSASQSEGRSRAGQKGATNHELQILREIMSHGV